MDITQVTENKLRYLPNYNYEAIWSKGYTVRLDIGPIKELPVRESEFYDVSLGTYCPNNCPFCYTSAKSSGRYYNNISDHWRYLDSKLWKSRKINGFEVTNKPFQIAIGSQGEVTGHPELPKFLETVKKTSIIPNYTTAGNIIGYLGRDNTIRKIRDLLIDSTEENCGAVAISLGNKNLRDCAFRSIDVLSGKCLITLHHIISDINSVEDFLSIRDKYKLNGTIHYHVLLPLVKSGRSVSSIDIKAFSFLENKLLSLKNNGDDINDIAFGAKFIPLLEKSNKLGIKLFPEQTYSKNLILEDNEAIFTRSSFNLDPIDRLYYNV